MSHSLIEDLLYNCKFHNIKDEQLGTITYFIDLAYADNATIKLSWPKTKLQNVGAGDPPSKILIDGVQVEGV